MDDTTLLADEQEITAEDTDEMGKPIVEPGTDEGEEGDDAKAPADDDDDDDADDWDGDDTDDEL